MEGTVSTVLPPQGYTWEKVFLQVALMVKTGTLSSTRENKGTNAAPCISGYGSLFVQIKLTGWLVHSGLVEVSERSSEAAPQRVSNLNYSHISSRWRPMFYFWGQGKTVFSHPWHCDYQVTTVGQEVPKPCWWLVSANQLWNRSTICPRWGECNSSHIR